MMRAVRKYSIPGVICTCLNYFLLTVLGIITLYPFWYILMYSLSSYQETLGKGAILWPQGFTLATIKAVAVNSTFIRAYANTIFVVVIGTLLSVLATALFAYPLSRKVRGTRVLNMFIYITMLFGGGMIPTFYVVRLTGLLDSLWSLILPCLVSPFNVFIMRSFFEGISGEMIESASIDGASELRIFRSVILPLSLPVLATITLFYAVMYWNKFMDAIIYISSEDKRPLQLLLRELITTSTSSMLLNMAAGATAEAHAGDVTPVTLKMATVTLSVLPIMTIYPFIQKYFVKGVMLGAIKG